MVGEEFATLSVIGSNPTLVSLSKIGIFSSVEVFTIEYSLTDLDALEGNTYLFNINANNYVDAINLLITYLEDYELKLYYIHSISTKSHKTESRMGELFLDDLPKLSPIAEFFKD